MLKNLSGKPLVGYFGRPGDPEPIGEKVSKKYMFECLLEDLDELREYDNLWVRDFEKDTLNNEEIWDQRSVWDALKGN